MITRPRNKWRVCHPGILFEQLEERIVLDAAAPVDHQHAADTQPTGIDQHTTSDVSQASQAAGQPNQAPQLPDSVDHVFANDLNVVLVSNAIDKIHVSEATAKGAQVIVFDEAHDSLETINVELKNLVESTGQKIEALAIISHGDDGYFTIGSDQITLFNLNNYKFEFEQLGKNLTENAQIQIYGCSLAGDGYGRALVTGIATYTGADVFASIDQTGGIQGNWNLEYASNSNIEAEQLLDLSKLAAMDLTLAQTYPTQENMWGVSMNGYLYFVYDDGAHGAELWKINATDPGPTMVADIYKGSHSSNPAWLTVYNGVLYFSASDGNDSDHHKTELWRSDGTEAGTWMVKDINPGNKDSNPAELKVVNGILYFAASDGNSNNPEEHGTELWRTDGTADGTWMVADINSGKWDSDPAHLTDVNGTLFFSADDGAHGTELWQSDGTESGTKLVKDINGLGDSNPAYLTNVNGVLFFSASDGASNHGVELWKSDGTSSGTVMVADINLDNQSSNPAYLTNVNGVLFFSASDGDSNHGTELWKSDGSGAGTVMVANINPDNQDSNPEGLLNVNGTLYFSANDGSHGTELWRSDGSGAGTVMVKDINPGSEGSSPKFLNNYDGHVLFAADDGTHGYELWHSDGTGDGTYMMVDIKPGVESSFPGNFARLNPLFFLADDGAGYQLWKSDGTVSGTVKLSDVNPASPDPRVSSPTPGRSGDSGWAGDGLQFADNSQSDPSVSTGYTSMTVGRNMDEDDFSSLPNSKRGLDFTTSESYLVPETETNPVKTTVMGGLRKTGPSEPGHGVADLLASGQDSQSFQTGSDGAWGPHKLESYSPLPGMIKIVEFEDGHFSVRSNAIALVITPNMWIPPMVKWYLTAHSEGRYRPGSLPKGYEEMIWDYLGYSAKRQGKEQAPLTDTEMRLAWQWAEWRKQVVKERGNPDTLPWSYFRGLSQALIVFYGQSHAGDMDYNEAINAFKQNVRHLTIIPVKLPDEASLAREAQNLK